MDTSYVLWLAIAGSIGFILGGPGKAATAILVCALYLLARDYNRRRDQGFEADEEGRRKREVDQEPALQKDNADWTRLDELALSIARHEVLTAWHKSGRSIIINAPVPNIEVEGGYETLADGFGEEISSTYEKVFREIRGMARHRQQDRLKVAFRDSLSARIACREKASTAFKDCPIEQPLPNWMHPFARPD